jgi:hypothetical protein
MAAISICGLATATQAAQPQTFTVDCAKGQTISAALDNGDARKPMVLIVKGTCNENITIVRDDVSLKGDAGATINASSASNAISVNGAHRILIDRLSVRGGNPRGISLVGGSNIDITNSDVQSAANHGINVQGTQAVNIINSSVQYSGRSGIGITQGSVVISNSQVSSNSGDGVRVTQAAAQISNSTIASNAGNGVAALIGSSLSLVSTSMTGNGGDGVSLYLAAVGNFSGNVNANGNAGSGLTAFVNSTAQLGDGPLSFQSIRLGQASSLWVNPGSAIPISVPGGIGCADAKSSANWSSRFAGPMNCTDY